MRKNNKVRLKRKGWGWSQDDLATLLGITRASLANIENGHRRPCLDNLLALQVVFGPSARELFPRLYETIEAVVVAKGARMDLAFLKEGGAVPQRKRELLADMMRRTTNNPIDA